jgi:hypothetical protein
VYLACSTVGLKMVSKKELKLKIFIFIFLDFNFAKGKKQNLFLINN